MKEGMDDDISSEHDSNESKDSLPAINVEKT